MKINLFLAFYNELRHIVWRDGVVVKFHSVVAPAFRHRPQRSDIAEHFRKRNFGVNHSQTASFAHIFYLALSWN